MPGPWQRAILHIQLANNQTKLVLKPSQWEHRRKKSNSELGYRCWPSGTAWSLCCQIKPRLHRKGRYPKQASNLLKGDKYLPSSLSTWCCISTPSASYSNELCLIQQSMTVPWEPLSEQERTQTLLPPRVTVAAPCGLLSHCTAWGNRRCSEYQSS